MTDLSRQKNICIHDPAGVAAIRAAGRLAAATLDMIAAHITEGITSEKLDQLCHDFIVENGGIPASLGYRGFSHSTCISFNHVVCHGIPGNRAIRSGDILNIDLAVILDGWYGDSSRMYAAGKVSKLAERLMDTTYDAMMYGIDAIRPGATLGDVGFAMQRHVEAQRFTVVRDFCGHGIGRNYHEPPNVLNYGSPGEGILLHPGMVLTVEPIVNIGRADVKILNDGWTAVTRDRTLSAQFEHTVCVTEQGVDILTPAADGLDRPYRRYQSR